MIALVALGVLIGAALQSATGFGFALVTAPMLFLAYEPGEALTAMTVLTIFLSLLVLLTERRDIHVHGHIPRLVAAGAPGLVIGVLLLDALGKPTLQVAVGVVVVVAALVDLRAFTVARSTGTASAAWPVLPLGFVVGTLTTTTGVNGPPLVMYFQRLGCDPHEVRDSLAACFLVFGPLAAVALLATGNLGLSDVGAPELVLLLTLVALGRPLGRYGFLRMSATHFRMAGVGMAVLAGVGSVGAGLLG